jgi:hypothetical protein
MDYHNDITQILEDMSSETSRIAIKIGKRRDQLRHVQNIYPPFSDGIIIDCLEENGLGTTCQFARLYFYDSNKNKLQTKSVNQMIEAEENQPSELGVMVDGILNMAAEMRRFVAVQNDSINVLVNRQADLMTNLFDSKEEIMVERAAAIGLDMELQAVKDEVESSYKTQAIRAVSQAATSFAESYQGKITPDKLVSLIMENPEYINHALENEELTNLIARKIAEKALT